MRGGVRCKTLLAVAIVGLGAGSLPAGAATTAVFPTYTGDQFNELFTTAPLPNLAPIGPSPDITGDLEVDDLIRSIAEGRGYRVRPLPAGALGTADGYPLQPPAATAWEALQTEAGAAGHSLVIVSAFRDIAGQRATFLGKLTGYSVAEIDARLRGVAPPGYSKHHTGYALDIAQAGSGSTVFGSTAAFGWLSANNYESAKRFGFIPSYPPDANLQGPDPEPWEYVYVGVDTALCGGYNLGLAPAIFPPDATGNLDDLRLTCPYYPVGRGSLAHYLARALGLTDNGGGNSFVDDDGLIFENDIALVAAAGIVGGCDPESTLFCPAGQITRGEMAALLVRALDLADAGDQNTFIDDDGSVFEADIEALVAAGITEGCNPPTNDRFCPEDVVTRGELAGFLEAALGPDVEISGAFLDDDYSVFETDVEWLAAVGITAGCNPPENDWFCPDGLVTRSQMAAFLVRALGYVDDDGGNLFVDDDGSVFESDIDRLGAAGVTAGCNPPENDRFCPEEMVTRGQMAALLHRALGS